MISILYKKKMQKSNIWLSFDQLFDLFFSTIIFLFALFYLNGNWKLEIILKNSNKSGFFSGSANIKLHKDWLQIFKQENSVLYYFLLVLKVLFNLISNNIYKKFKIFKVFLKKDFKLTLEQKIFDRLVL